jgi:hypothetical protein
VLDVEAAIGHNELPDLRPVTDLCFQRFDGFLEGGSALVQFGRHQAINNTLNLYLIPAHAADPGEQQFVPLSQHEPIQVSAADLVA